MNERHSSLEKYTSHFIESVVCERELETKQRLQHIDLPSSSGHSSVSFSFYWAAQPGAWGSALCRELVLAARSRTLVQALNCNCSIEAPEAPPLLGAVLSTASYLQLTRTFCALSYIIVLRLLNLFP